MRTSRVRRALLATIVAAVVACRSAAAPPPPAVAPPPPSLAGRVADADGRALAGAVVVAEPVPAFAGRPESRRPVETTAGADGAYAFPGLDDGDWELRVSADGAARAPAGVLRLPGVSRFDVALPVGARIAGTLVDAATHAPIAGARVRAFESGGEAVADATTSASGAFEALTHRESASVDWFRADAPGRCTVPAGFTGTSDFVGEGHSLDVALTLGRGATLTGAVTGPSGPVAGAAVELTINPSQGDVERRTLTTDAAGRYEVRCLDEGTSVAVRVVANGLADAALRDAELGPPERFFWDCPGACRVEGLPATGVVEHDVTLLPAAPWTTPWGLPPPQFAGDADRVHGRVTSSDGSAVAHARVVVVAEYGEGVIENTAIVRGGPFGPTFEVRATAADEHGAYALDVPWTDGRVTVHAEAPGLLAGEASAGAVGAGADSTIDVVLPAPSTVVGRVVIAGTLHGVAGVPVAVSTHAWSEGETAYDEDHETFVVCAVTDADGAFRVVTPPERRRFAAGGGAWMPKTAVVGAARAEPVVFELEPAETLEGTATLDDGAPARGVEVTVWPRPREDCVGTDSVGQPRVVGHDGRFVVRGLRRGSYWLGFAHGDLQVQPATAGPFDAGSRGVAVRLARGATIAGRVVLPSGAPAARVPVFADPGAEGRPRGVEYSADDGTFAIGGLDAGTYDLRGRADGFVLAILRGVRAGRAAVVLRLDTGLSIDGTVFDADGRPVAGATVECDPALRVSGGWGPTPQRATTDAAGRFAVAGLVAVRWKLRVEDAEFNRLADDVEADAGATGVVVRCRAAKK